MDELTEVITQTAECDLSTKEIIWDKIRKAKPSVGKKPKPSEEKKLDEVLRIKTNNN
ncbi:MAG: hypothetical protein MJZ28_02435 [Paludibacteraceae bacterium]|nr:hypothetical protein [Paludibacteraceae bacterium]